MWLMCHADISNSGQDVDGETKVEEMACGDSISPIGDIESLYSDGIVRKGMLVD